jgi:D-alanyl-D-alanine carboxypeptidase (penicillin-binding protein 5/6)
MSYEITDPLYKEGATITGFLSGETVPLKDMMYGVILSSGGDAAVGLAVKIAGSEEAFVEMMNQKAKELGMKNTHYANATGLHNEGNYTSAYDMAILIDAAMKNELCREILTTKTYTTVSTEQHPEGLPFESTLFSHMKGTEPETATIIGGKTGYISMSKYCIASFGVSEQSGDEYIVVTLGNSSRWPAMNGQITLYKEYAK